MQKKVLTILLVLVIAMLLVAGCSKRIRYYPRRYLAYY